MERRVVLSIDCEQDCPPFLQTYRGMEEGIFEFMSCLHEYEVKASFFVTGDVARRFPGTIRKIVKEGHELACHGDSHDRFDRMDLFHARLEIQKSTETLRQFSEVTSFRAPNLAFPAEYYDILEEFHYLRDASEAKYKRRKKISTRLKRYPASMTSSLLRIPKLLRFPMMIRHKEPLVLFTHPWEYVDFRKEKKMRLDCRFRTGEKALLALRENIIFLKRRGYEFKRLCDL